VTNAVEFPSIKEAVALMAIEIVLLMLISRMQDRIYLDPVDLGLNE
jgi:hypothetical protein